MTTISPSQLAAFSASGNRKAYVRGWYLNFRSTGCAARFAYRQAVNFWNMEAQAQPSLPANVLLFKPRNTNPAPIFSVLN